MHELFWSKRWCFETRYKRVVYNAFTNELLFDSSVGMFKKSSPTPILPTFFSSKPRKFLFFGFAKKHQERLLLQFKTPMAQRGTKFQKDHNYVQPFSCRVEETNVFRKDSIINQFIFLQLLTLCLCIFWKNKVYEFWEEQDCILHRDG